jgi:hypothetical protein
MIVDIVPKFPQWGISGPSRLNLRVLQAARRRLLRYRCSADRFATRNLRRDEPLVEIPREIFITRNGARSADRLQVGKDVNCSLRHDQREERA